jgi:hypothetical protein
VARPGWCSMRGCAGSAIRECLFGGLWAFQALPALALMLFGAKKASSIEALAERIGADPAALRSSVVRYNAAARGRADDPLGKSADMRQACERPVLSRWTCRSAARCCRWRRSRWAGCASTRPTAMCATSKGRDIPGLYAAGRSAVGIPSSRYMSGLSLADCVFSGRRAGAQRPSNQGDRTHGTTRRQGGLVTGGASGVGRETVLRLVREGARVVLTDLNEAGGHWPRRSASTAVPAPRRGRRSRLDARDGAAAQSASARSTCWSTTPAS